MGKDKLKRFAENEIMPNVVQPEFSEAFNQDYKLKGKWTTEFFKEDLPLVLELGCGKGEYTVALARKYPQRNHLGIDIKGARLWRGAKTAIEEKIHNAGFLRTRIEWISSFFGPEEVCDIWITFPDPQLKERRAKKRLTGSLFLNRYKEFLIEGGKVHLKTDSAELYAYTKALLQHNGETIFEDLDDIYSQEDLPEILHVKTHYEKIFLEEGKKITYLQFKLDKNKTYIEPPEEDEVAEENGEG